MTAPFTKASAPLLIDRRKVTLVVVDAQERPAAAARGKAIRVRLAALVAGARIMDVPVLFTEQLSETAGPVLPELVAEAPDAPVVRKSAFKATAELAFTSHLVNLARRQVVVAGFEAHVSVLQTVLALAAADYQVFVVGDAVASRTVYDRYAAVRRMLSAGAHEVTAEMVLCEWLETSDNRRFEQLEPELAKLAEL